MRWEKTSYYGGRIKTVGLSKEIVKGLQFDRGYVSPYLVTNTEKMEAVLEDPYIIITDQKFLIFMIFTATG